MLTDVQREIERAPKDGAILVIAGAGSGKTRVLTHRVVYLIKELGVPDHAIVGLTFTNKAAKEMKDRVVRMYGQSTNPFMGTFHKFCIERILKHYVHHLDGYKKDFTIYDAKDSLKLIKDIIATANLPYLKANDGDPLKIVDYHIGNWKSSGMTLKEYKNDIADRDDADDIIQVFELYQKRLRGANAFDFDDLILKSLELLETVPFVLDTLQEKYQYFLVDEFQDTNVPQYRIIKLLAEKHKNIMAVGDEDQCIFTWRGASIQNIREFINDFGPKIYKLEQNFRSCRNIVELANTLISTNEGRIEKTLFSENDEGCIELHSFNDDRSEAMAVTYKILDETCGGGNFSDFAVLMRNNAISRVFEEQFLKHRIPYVMWGGHRFYERAEVKTAMSYLKLLVNPEDYVSLENAISTPRRGVGAVAIQKIRDKDFDSLAGKAKQGYQDFVGVLEKLKKVYIDEGLEILADKFLEITGLLKAYETGKDEDRRKIENIYELVNAVGIYAREVKGTLSDFLQSVTLDVGENEESGDRVVISTIHKSKGLEFKHVFVVANEEGILPGRRALNNHADLQEERRLLYVAMTRACESLWLSYSKSRFLQGETKYQRPSRFLSDCGLLQKNNSWNDYDF